MSTLNITVIKTHHTEFTGYSGSGIPQFATMEYMKLGRTFDSEASGARYIADILLRDWNSGYGSSPSHFRFESTLGTDKIYNVRPCLQGEVPDFTSPLTGDWYFQPIKTFRG